MIDYELIGKRIREIRVSRMIRQAELAEKSDLTVEYISKIENGRAKPTLEALGKICEILRCDMSELFGGVMTAQPGYKLHEISEYYQECRPEIKPIALELVEKLSKI